jgi:hypothetical protein
MSQLIYMRKIAISLAILAVGKGASNEEIFEHVLRGVSGRDYRGGNRRGREG